MMLDIRIPSNTSYLHQFIMELDEINCIKSPWGAWTNRIIESMHESFSKTPTSISIMKYNIKLEENRAFRTFEIIPPTTALSCLQHGTTLSTISRHLICLALFLICVFVGVFTCFVQHNSLRVSIFFFSPNYPPLPTHIQSNASHMPPPSDWSGHISCVPSRPS